MTRVNYKKALVTIAASLYFVICWMICHLATPGYLSVGIDRIYFEHGITKGYYSIRSYLVLYIAALLFYIIMMMREDQMYIVIRYFDREEIWKTKIIYMILYIFQFTIIHFGVDIILMFCFYSASEIVYSQILIYLLMFFPNVFFYYVFFISVFLMFQVLFATEKALMFTISIAVLIYVVMASGIVPLRNPFFFLSMLSIQIQNGINEADLILSYMNILSLDIIAMFTGLKRYHNKNDIF